MHIIFKNGNVGPSDYVRLAVIKNNSFGNKRNFDKLLVHRVESNTVQFFNG
jgi:hypothetical protein